MPIGTKPGEFDPLLAWRLMRGEKLSTEDLARAIVMVLMAKARLKGR